MSIGETLASAREAAGLTTAQVSERTSIRAGIISALEHDDFTQSSGDFYAKAHIRTIAASLALDPAALMAEFDEVQGVTGPTPTQVFEAETSTHRERFGPNWSAAMAAAVVVLIAVVGVQLVRASATNSHQQTTLSGPSPTPSVTLPSSHTPKPQPSQSNAVAQVTTNGVRVRISANGTSWISITDATNHQLFQGLVNAGDVKDFRDPKRLNLVIGNAGAIDLVVNGRDLGSPGTSGQVVRLSFRPGDPQGSPG